MDIPRRLTLNQVYQILAAGGIMDITSDSDYDEVLVATVTTARLVAHAYDNDRALVYAGLIQHMESVEREPLWLTEDYFFNPFYEEEERHGKERTSEGPCVREKDRQVAADHGPGRSAEPNRNAERKRGGRSRTVEVTLPSRTTNRPDRGSEVPEGAIPLEGNGSGTFGGCPF